MKNSSDNHKISWGDLGIQPDGAIKEESVKIKLKIPHTNLDLIAKETGKNKKTILESIVSFFIENQEISNNLKNNKYTRTKDYQFKSYTIGKNFISLIDELIHESYLSRSDMFTIGINILCVHLNIEEKPHIKMEEINYVIKILEKISNDKYFEESLSKLTKYSADIKEYDAHLYYSLNGLFEEIKNFLIEQEGMQ